MPVITLPDGSQRSFDNPVSVHDVAADIGPGLAKAALAGVVDGREVDTSHLIEGDANIAIITDRQLQGSLCANEALCTNETNLKLNISQINYYTAMNFF